MSKRLNNYIWVEKFRPASVSEMVLPNIIKNSFLSFIKDGQIPNMILFSSTPGSGKTTAAKAICRDLEADSMYINSSKDSGIDTLRERIYKFASSKSMTGAPKIIILDEFDGASKTLQKGLRAAVEEFKNSCRFIFTCNYITQIIDPLKSRCQLFDMNHTEEMVRTEMMPQVLKRINTIIKFEGITVTEPTIPNRIVDKFFPDIRKCIMVLQQYAGTTKILDDKIFTFETIDAEFYELIIQGKLKSVREYVKKKNYNYDELYSKLFNELLPLVEERQKVPKMIICLNDYQVNNSNVVDKELNFAACTVELVSILKND